MSGVRALACGVAALFGTPWLSWGDMPQDNVPAGLAHLTLGLVVWFFAVVGATAFVRETDRRDRGG